MWCCVLTEIAQFALCFSQAYTFTLSMRKVAVLENQPVAHRIFVALRCLALVVLA